MLVNYWWNDANPALGSPLHCLLHGMLALRDLPPVQRRVWRAVFDHYVFEMNGDPAAHLAPEHRGVLGQLTPEYRKRVTSLLLQSLNRP